ncbi:MAG: deoxyribonuclease IV [Fusobacteria bacterium]|nr:deoxyribonuclease IV [Fusobacteriota bacterium]
MKYIGAHVSAAGGVENAPINAGEIEAKAFALFTKNQKRWEASPLTTKNIKSFRENIIKFGINEKFILPHNSYLINLGNPEKENREKSIKAFIDEVNRTKDLGLLYINGHPGSHLNKITEEESLDYISESINEIIKNTELITIVIENTSGQGSNLGYKFEHLAYIIDRILNKDRIGVCLDTCHTFTGGYDLRTKEAYTKTMDEFEKIIGFNYLKGVHLNDSKTPFNSRVDRHHSIGKGELGEEFFKLFMNDKRFNNMPIILETIDTTLWKDEIKFLYSLQK